MKLIFTLFLLSSFTAFASSECKKLSHYQLKMDVHGMNFENSETTRTPEGGAYKHKHVSCGKKCKVIESQAIITKYLPGHPDTNSSGYVIFPDINKDEEKAFLSSYARTLVSVAKKCPEMVEVFDSKNGPSAFMKYKEGNVLSDAINFMPDGSIISWVRATKNGSSKILNL